MKCQIRSNIIARGIKMLSPLTKQEWKDWGEMCRVFFCVPRTAKLYAKTINNKDVKSWWLAIQELDDIGRNVADSYLAVMGWQMWRRAMLSSFAAVMELEAIYSTVPRL